MEEEEEYENWSLQLHNYVTATKNKRNALTQRPVARHALEVTTTLNERNNTENDAIVNRYATLLHSTVYDATIPTTTAQLSCRVHYLGKGEKILFRFHWAEEGRVHIYIRMGRKGRESERNEHQPHQQQHGPDRDKRQRTLIS